MNGEGGIGRAEEDLKYLRGDFVTGIDFGSASGSGFYPDISLGFFPSLPQTFFELPPILPGPPVGSEAPGDSATPGTASLPATVVDPELGPQTTVFEQQGAPYVAPRTRETDWDWVYDRYVVLNAPQAPEIDVPFHDNIDWGTIAGNVIGGIFDPFGAGAATTAFFNPPNVVASAMAGPPVGPAPMGITGVTNMQTGAGCPPLGPKYAKICLATREITPLRRRRRRRLLTSSDIKDLAALKAIVGGAALQGAVVQAIRR